MKIYLATSWRNQYHPVILNYLRDLGHEVYNFKRPGKDLEGFSWSDVDTEWNNWNKEEYRDGLDHPAAETGFHRDMFALKTCDVCILLLPSGRSAHLEAGWAIGYGKPVIIFQIEMEEAELMYKAAYALCYNGEELKGALDKVYKYVGLTIKAKSIQFS